MKEPDNIIKIGKKPFLSYVHSAQLNLKENKEIKIWARGKTISKAVDIAEIIEKKFMKGEVEKISITSNSEQFDSKEKPGKRITVSSIEITLRLIQKDL